MRISWLEAHVSQTRSLSLDRRAPCRHSISSLSKDHHDHDRSISQGDTIHFIAEGLATITCCFFETSSMQGPHTPSNRKSFGSGIPDFHQYTGNYRLYLQKHEMQIHQHHLVHFLICRCPLKLYLGTAVTTSIPPLTNRTA